MIKCRKVSVTVSINENEADVLFYGGMPAVRIVRREPYCFDLYHYCDLAESAGPEYFAADGPYMSQSAVRDALLKILGKRRVSVDMLGQWYGK